MTTPTSNALGTLGVGFLFSLILLIIVTALPPSLRVGLAAAETRYFPVMLPATLSNPRDVQGGCEFSVEAYKERSCPWRQTLVYWGERNGINVQISDAPHLEKPRLLDVGLLYWKRVFIPMNCKELQNTFADTMHECRGPDASLTRSEFWEHQIPTITDTSP